MAQNPTEIELDPIVFSVDDLQDIELDPVDPVQEFTLVPEGDASSAGVGASTEADTYALEIKAAEKREALAEPVDISKVLLTPEIVDDFRLNFGTKASESLAKDLVGTFEEDYADQIKENSNFFSYDLLRSGKAAFFDQLSPSYTMEVNGEQKPIRDMLPAERAARFTNPDAISALLSNADTGSLPRAFFGELFKATPSTYVGTQAAKATAALTFRTPPTSLYSFVGKSIPPVISFLAGSLLLYKGADALEEGLIGPDQVVLPGQKSNIEAMRTAGGSVAGIQFPFLMSQKTNRFAREVLSNLAEDAPRPTAIRLTAALEEMIEGIGNAAKGSKSGAGLTVLGESTAGLGSTVFAKYAEEIDPGSSLTRLGFEFLGANTFAATLGKLLPKIYLKAFGKNIPGGENVSGEENAGMEFINKVASGKQKKLFSRMNELYELHDGNYEAMMGDLNNPETNQILKEVFPDVDFTAGQRLDDDSGIIMMVEAAMAGDNPELNAARMKADRNAKKFFDKWITGLLADGSQDSLKTAAFLRKNMFSDAIRRRLTSAVDQRAKAVEQLQKGPLEGAHTQEQFSIKLADTLDAQTKLARAQESRFWDKVGQFTVFEADDVMDTDFTPSFIRQYDEMLGEIDFQGGAYKKSFIESNKELHNTIQNMKRSLGIDIREGIKQQDAIVGRLLESNSEVISKLFSNDISELRRAQAGLSPFKDTASATRVLQDLKKGKLGTETISKAEQKIMVAFSEAQVKRLELMRAKADPERLIGISASDLIKLRREVRNEAVSFYSGATTKVGSANEARRFGELSEKILDDMHSVPEGANEAYDEATAYSYALNEVLIRSLVGKMRAKNAMGGRRIPPELLTQEFLRQNPNVTNLRIKDLQAVSEFAHEQGFEGATETFTTINNIVESALREARKEAVSAEGKVNVNNLNNWKRNNAELLEKFPTLKRDLDNAVAAQRTFDVWSARSKKGKSLVDSQVYLSTVLRNTSPTAAISDALSFVPKGGQSKDPAQGLARLFRLSRLSFRDAAGKLLPEAEQRIRQQAVREGYQDAILQYAFMSSGGESTSTFDPVTFHKTLFGTLDGEGVGASKRMPSYLDKHGSKSSLVEVAQRYGVFDEKLLVRIRTISNQMVRLAAADAAGKLNDPHLQKQAGPIFDFYVGMVGLAAGSKAYQTMMGGQGGTGSISAAAAGKRFILDLFKDLPASQRLSVFQLVFTDPEMAANLLRKPQNTKEAVNQLSRIQKFFLDRGFSVTSGQSPYIQRELYEDEDRGTGMTREEMSQNSLPPASNQVRKVQRERTLDAPTVSASTPEQRPFVVAQAPVAQQPPAPQARPSDSSGVASLLPAGGAQSNASSQQRYAAAYPNDSISDLIRMRGTA